MGDIAGELARRLVQLEMELAKAEADEARGLMRHAAQGSAFFRSRRR